MTKRLLAIVLLVAVTLTTVPITAFAEPEPTALPTVTIDEQYIEDGAFYFASASAEIEENAGHGYLLKVCRFGDATTAQSVRLVMTDVTASYGKDYTVKLYGESGASVENAKESQSMLEYLETNETEEYNYADAIIDGTIGASDQLTEEEQSALELNDSEKQAVEVMSQEVLASLSGEEETSAASAEPTGSGSALAAARENAVGLADDRAPMSYTLPEDSGLQNDSTGYMQDGISEVSEELNAAYLTLDFAAGETEKTVMITPKDNDKSDGTLQTGFALEGVDDAIVSGMYGNFTLKILDDEPYVPDVIEFGAAAYTPQDGYVTVTVKRSGSLTSVLTASLDSADDTAIGGLDYSEVHAKLVFGFGLEERTIRIPVRSTSLTGPVSFKLVLHDPQECVIGENSTAVCTILPTDESFEGKDEAALEKLEKNSLGVAQDIDLGSEVIGDPFCLPELEKCNYLYDTSSKAEAYEKNGWYIIDRDSRFYPEALKGIKDAPFVLYCAGDPAILVKEPKISVVGTRNPTDKGLMSAYMLACCLSSLNVVTVSGGALGIDSASHEGALTGNGGTLAVLGSGFGAEYLPENTFLRRRIGKNGALITEQPPFEEPTRYSFPRRNRIISGMSEGILVVEGDERSGARITANLALEQGKELFAVPGSIYSPRSRTPNELIYNGAYCALSAWDILEGMRWGERPQKRAARKTVSADLTGDERKIADALAAEPLGYEELSERTGLSAAVLSPLLTTLTLRGIVTELPGGLYRAYL